MSSSSLNIFFQKPLVVYADENYSVPPPAWGKIESLMESLRKNGPLVTVAKVGPSAYTSDSFALKKESAGVKIHGWKAGGFKPNAPQITAILLGASKTETNSYVFYTLAKDVTRSKDSLIRGFTPLNTDEKVYVMTYEHFKKRSLVNLHPICPHAQWLFSVNANAILDGSETQEKCKIIGQEIFDHYKTIFRGDSGAAKDAMMGICNAAKFLTPEKYRARHIEVAWDGVGDSHIKWRG